MCMPINRKPQVSLRLSHFLSLISKHSVLEYLNPLRPDESLSGFIIIFR